MFEIICLSIAFIAISVTIFFQEKEISKLRHRCNAFQFTLGLLSDSLSCLENDVDDFKRVSDTVPKNE